MKFLLTVFICSAVGGECVIPSDDTFIYPKTFNSHYACVRQGLSDSYEILYASSYFKEDDIEKYRLYPTFSCEKKVVPLPKPKVETGEPA